jgi:hypothetical protein
MIIKNDSGSIKKYLEKSYKEVLDIKHIGNFVFEATTPAGTVKIITEPVNENEIKILLVK